jgi:hypothetical protein
MSALRHNGILDLKRRENAQTRTAIVFGNFPFIPVCSHTGRSALKAGTFVIVKRQVRYGGEEGRIGKVLAR